MELFNDEPGDISGMSVTASYDLIHKFARYLKFKLICIIYDPPLLQALFFNSP